ncbi:MAG: hypothetical protein R3D80_03035 [Paracoccaceae bacterium]
MRLAARCFGAPCREMLHWNRSHARSTAISSASLWDRLGADAWLAPWSLAAARAQGSAQSVVDLLDTLEDLATRSAADMLVNANPDPEAAPDALREAFDHDGISELKVFTIGDGEAMSGLLIAAQDRETSEAIVLVFLMD